MKYIFGIRSEKSAEYKQFVSDSIKSLSAHSKKVQLAHTLNSILSFMVVDNYKAIFVDWAILSKNFNTFQRQLNKINKFVPLIVITDNSKIHNELFIPCSSLFRVVSQSSAKRTIHKIHKDITQYYKLVESLSPSAKSVIRPVGFKSMIGNSNVMLSVYNQLAKVSETDFTTLILGESGCGKEFAAQTIHNLSKRNNQKLVSLNCAAIPSTLQESELFGYEKGAFTSADVEKDGKFELANNGTLFFDEIGDMPLDLQSKLLRVLENNTFMRLGGNKEKIINVRYIAATNQNLQTMIKDNSFRFDLFYRLNVIPIKLPKLKERDNDIVLLSLNFIGKLLQQGSLSIKSITWDFINALKELPLIGNIRELENILTRTLFNSSGSVLDKKSLNEIDINSESAEKPLLDFKSVNNEIIPLNQIEKIVINNALNAYRGNISKVAQVLEISRSALYRKIKKYNLEI